MAKQKKPVHKVQMTDAACRQRLYKHQCCCTVGYILQILFSSYLISLSFDRSSVTKSEAFQSVHHVTFILCYTVLYDFLLLYFPLSDSINAGGTI